MCVGVSSCESSATRVHRAEMTGVVSCSKVGATKGPLLQQQVLLPLSPLSILENLMFK